MTAAYDAIADWYDTQVRTPGGRLLFHALVIDALLMLAGEVQVQEVGDLACGRAHGAVYPNVGQ